jgi:malonyl CoA-acyl carrier protein transacylase
MTTAQSAPPAAAQLMLAAPDLTGLLAALDAPAPTAYRGPGPRLALIDPTPDRLAAARRLVAKGKPVRRRADLWFSPQPLLAGGRGIAFLFPGLEGEFTPRVDDVAEHLDVPAPEVSTATVGRYGASVLAVGRLLDAAVRRLGIRPSAVAGHSVGEWAAMIAGGIVSGAEFDAMIDRADLDALRVPGVEFAVLGCSADRVRPELAGHPELVISHENSANQTVICGPQDAVAELVALLRAKAVICQPLPFRSGFHTPMLEPYLDYFRAGVPNLRMRPAGTPVWSATTAAPFPDDPAAARRLCLRHLVEPVRFRQLVRGLHDSGVRAFVQLGPGQLGSLVEDTLRHDAPDADFLVVAANSPHRSGLDQLRRCALALWAEGAEPDFAVLDPPTTESIPRPPPAAAPEPADWPGFARLTALGSTTPLAAELAAFLDDTADAVAAVLRVAQRTEHRQILDVSLRTMPYLHDHCLMRQRPGWPDEADLRAVVPATTMVARMISAAEQVNPGLVAIGVADIRLHRWLPAAPPRQVTIHVEQRAVDQVHVRLGEHAEGTVLLGTRRVPAPTGVWPAAAGERSPEISAEQLYQERWLFHGPAFQGMTRTIAVSDTTIRGVITTPPAPGALLDNLGQFLGHWLVENQRNRWIALPSRIGRIDLHGPDPAPVSTVDCAARVTELDADSVAADGQLSQHGVPVISVHGWVARRFDSDQRAGTAYRLPAVRTLAERHADGWWWAAERWRTLSSREFYLHRYAGNAECAEYERLNPADRRAWLLRLVAVKDAVRGWLWKHGAAPIYPAELRVHQAAPGRYRVSGQHGLAVPALDIAVGHHAEVAVALVRPAGSGQGIEITEWAAGAPGSRIDNPAGLPQRAYLVRAR